MKIFFFLFLFAASSFAVAETPEPRIVSLAPSITETLFLLGLEKEIVGVTANCDYPSETAKIEKVGFFGSPNLEKIVTLKPTLVLASDLGRHAVLLRLKDLAIKTVVLPSQNITEVLESIQEIGNLTNQRWRAKRLVSRMEGRIDRVKRKVLRKTRPKVLVILWSNPRQIMTVGKKSFVHELVELAGGENIAGKINLAYPILNPEFIVASNPEVIISGYSLARQLPLKGIRAIKDNRVFADIHPDLFLRPGPRLVEGLEELAKRLHP